MNAPLTPPLQALQTSSGSDTYPPPLSETARELAQNLLRSVKPELNAQTTWLVYRDSTLPPDAESSIHSTPLITSLIEHFTGKLSWDDNDIQGLYPEPSSSVQTPVIEPLSRKDILDLYAGVSQQLEAVHRRKLTDYWAAAQPDGETRSSTFVKEQVECLKSECAVRIALGHMTTGHYNLLSAALRACVFSAVETPEYVQPHSIYSLSAFAGDGAQTALDGAFVITRSLSDAPAPTDEETLEDVLLFTPEKGLEAFASFKQMNAALVQRGAEPEFRRRLEAPLNAAQKSPPGVALQWQYSLLEGNFLSVLFARQITWQQSVFAQAVLLARARRLDNTHFEQLISSLLSPEIKFDNHRHLDRFDADLIQTQMPAWWSAMTQPQQEQWLDQAQQFGESVVTMQKASTTYFNKPEADSRSYLSRYIDNQLAEALKRAAVETDAHLIMVSLTYSVFTQATEIPGAPVPSVTETARMSFMQLAHTRVHRVMARNALLIEVKDYTGAPVAHVDKHFIRGLIANIEDPQHLDSYLDFNLKTSAYAKQLKQARKAMLEGQMKMTLLEIEQQSFAPAGREWIQTVLDSPAPQGRRTINCEAIEVRFFSVNQFKMTNIMLIAPAEKFDKGPLVLCTLDASDGVVFRWFNSMFHLTNSFLETEPFQRYMLAQIPVSRRLEMLRAMQYEKQAKHWRPPEILTRLSLIPIPTQLLRPMVFIRQSEDFYEESHETRINQLILEAKQRMSPTTDAVQAGRAFNILAGIALLFLPEPIMMPIALGMGLYTSWRAFSKIEENDLEGAAEEFLNAVDYLAMAAIGRLALTLKPAVHASRAIRPPHLIRRVGRDGKVQIGYLLSHTGAPRFADSTLTVALDSQRFVAIQIDNQTCFVSRRANLFGHSRLYRPHPTDAKLLVHEQEYALRSTSGTWKTVGKEIPRISLQAIRNAGAQLTTLLADWPATLQEASAAERLKFEADYLALGNASNAENLSEITAYAEGGSAEINPLLRSGVSNATTRKFLRQFYRLKEWRGTAFRATYVSSEGLARLEREIGAVFSDSGVQSASVSRANAVNWSQDGFVSENANTENHPVFFIFAPAVPKKNMFTGFLGDHVAVPPATPMQLGATQRLNGQLFAWFDLPEQLVDRSYDLYTGAQEFWV